MYKFSEELMGNMKRSGELILRAGGEIYQPGTPWIQIFLGEEASGCAEKTSPRAPSRPSALEWDIQVREVRECQSSFAIF